MDDIRQRLAQLGVERTEARVRALELSQQIAELAQLALDAGITKTEIAQLAQVSRTALDAMLNHGDAK